MQTPYWKQCAARSILKICSLLRRDAMLLRWRNSLVTIPEIDLVREVWGIFFRAMRAINDLYKDYAHKGSWVNEKFSWTRWKCNSFPKVSKISKFECKINLKEVILPPKPSCNNIIFRHVTGMGMVIVLLVIIFKMFFGKVQMEVTNFHQHFFRSNLVKKIF